MNLKDRTLSQWLGLGDGNWELPAKGAKKAWGSVHPLPGNTNLKVLAAPKNPETLSKLGEAGGLPALFEQLGSMADVVIVDASPLAAVNRGNVDAVAVAAASARTILIAQAGVTAAPNLKRAADSLLLVGAPLLGVVLNQQFSLSRRQLLGQLADAVGKVLPPLGRSLRRLSVTAALD
jgi:Mrp family chromosome partitioning ATPase